MRTCSRRIVSKKHLSWSESCGTSIPPRTTKHLPGNEGGDCVFLTEFDAALTEFAEPRQTTYCGDLTGSVGERTVPSASRWFHPICWGAQRGSLLVSEPVEPRTPPIPAQGEKCPRCSEGVLNLLTFLPSFASHPKYRIYRCLSCGLLEWIAERNEK